METNETQSKLSLHQSQTGIAAYFQAIKERAKTLDETLIGKNHCNSALEHLNDYGIGGYKFSVKEAWFGSNIQLALRQDYDKTMQAVKNMFKTVLLEMNADHPWTNKELGQRQMARMIDFDPSWTLEDFAVFFDLMSQGQLGHHYNRPSRQWINACQVAYNELKFEAREEIARQAKAKAQVEEMKAADPQWTSDAPSKPRTMAEFLSGKNYLSAMDRAEMAERDKARKA